MKLVKESLYEKFEENSDPVEDMGVGIREKIENYFNKKINWNNNLEIYLHFTKILTFPDTEEYIRLFIKLGVDINKNDGQPLRIAAYYENYNYIYKLLEYGANFELALEDADPDPIKPWHEDYEKANRVRTNLLYAYKIYQNNNDIVKN